VQSDKSFSELIGKQAERAFARARLDCLTDHEKGVAATEAHALLDLRKRFDRLAEKNASPDAVRDAAYAAGLEAGIKGVDNAPEMLPDAEAYQHALRVLLAVLKAREHSEETAVNLMRYELITAHSRGCAAVRTHKSCPCEFGDPCSPQCSCGHPFLSGGCRRCCRYGSPAQQRAAAEHIVKSEKHYKQVLAGAAARSRNRRKA